jgi:hypothetical protein
MTPRRHRYMDVVVVVIVAVQTVDTRVEHVVVVGRYPTSACLQRGPCVVIPDGRIVAAVDPHLYGPLRTQACVVNTPIYV